MALKYRQIVGFPGYFASVDGFVWSRKKRGRNSKNILGKELRCMQPWRGPGGYLRIELYHDGQRFIKKVHRLICEAFNGPCPSGMECRHLNGDKTDNRANNLCWGTRGDNVADMIQHGQMVRSDGEKNGNAKLTENDVLSILAAYFCGTTTYKQLAKLYGVSLTQIGQIVRRERWRYLGER
jgi:hypothetical protein